MRCEHAEMESRRDIGCSIVQDTEARVLGRSEQKARRLVSVVVGRESNMGGVVKGQYGVDWSHGGPNRAFGGRNERGDELD